MRNYDFILTTLKNKSGSIIEEGFMKFGGSEII